MTTAPTHVLSDEWLLDYAAGTAPGPVAAFVAAHLALSPAARRAYSCLEAVGGALLDTLAPEAVAPDALSAVMARLDEAPEPTARSRSRHPDADILPPVLQDLVPRGMAALSWTRKARGFYGSALSCPDARGLHMQLLRLEPNCAVPRHTHHGSEMVLVLDGGYHDAQGHFVRGDVQIADDSVDHMPVADPGPVCVALVVTQAPPILTGFPRNLLRRLRR